MSYTYEEMGKVELRAACKAEGIKGYGNMTNDLMRAALNAKVDAVKASLAAANAAQGIGAQGSDGRPRPTVEVRKHGTGIVVVATPVVREKVVGTVVKAKSLKIEKGRTKQNGVTQPSTGSICRTIWDSLDTERSKRKAVPTFENLRDLMKQFGWARNTAMTQFQRWKQFNGVMPRSATDDAADETVTDGTDDDSQDE